MADLTAFFVASMVGDVEELCGRYAKAVDDESRGGKYQRSKSDRSSKNSL